MIEKIDFNFFNDNVIDKKTAVIDCYTDWCGYCKMLSPVLEQLSEEYEDKIDFFSINTDEDPEFAEKYEIMSLPTLLFLKDGNIVERTVGFLPKEQIVNILESKMN